MLRKSCIYESRLVLCSRNVTSSRKLSTNDASLASLRRPLPRSNTSRARLLGYTALSIGLGTAALIAFNHQRSSSSITHSTFYAVRKDPVALDAIGDNIRYRDYWPWISGTINHNKGLIDFSYAVQGDRRAGLVHFHCIRQGKHDWKILDWSLQPEGAQSISLTQDEMNEDAY